MDILRGMTVCLMIIVNNGVGRLFPFLRHVQWDGMTPSDAALLVVYAVMLLLGNGYVNDGTSIVAKVNLAVPGRNHMYRQRPVDPEGLLDLIPPVAHTIIGFLCGLLLYKKKIYINL